MLSSVDSQESLASISARLRGLVKENSILEATEDYINITHEINVYLKDYIREARIYTKNGFSSIRVYTNKYNLYCSDLPEDLCKLLKSYLGKTIKGYITPIHKVCEDVGVSYRKLRLFSQLIRGALKIAEDIVIDRELPICNSIYTGDVKNPLYKIRIVKNDIEINEDNFNILITQDKKIIRYKDGIYFNVYNPQVMESLTINDIRIVNAIVHLLELDMEWFGISDLDYTITKNDLERIKKTLRYANPSNVTSSRFIICMNYMLNDYISELALGFIPSLVMLKDSYERVISTYPDIDEEYLWDELNFRNL